MSCAESENFYKLIKKSIDTFNNDFNKEEIDCSLKDKYMNWLSVYFNQKIDGNVIFVNSFYKSIKLLLNSIFLQKDLLITYNQLDKKVLGIIKESKVRNHLLNIDNDFNLNIIYNILKNKIRCNIFLYIEPSNNFPTTYTLSDEKRDYVIHVSNQYNNFYIIFNDSNQFYQRIDNIKYKPLFTYSKNIISILSLTNKLNNRLNFNSILFKDNSIIDILNKNVINNDYNISFIENILLNEFIKEDKITKFILDNKDKQIEKYNKIKLLLDKNKIEYIDTKYLNSFMINFNFDIPEELKESLNKSFIFSNNFEKNHGKFDKYVRLEYDKSEIDNLLFSLSKIIKFIKNMNKIRISILCDQDEFITNFENHLIDSNDYCVYQKLNNTEDIDVLNNVLFLKGKKVNEYLKSLINIKCKIPLVIDSETKINDMLLKQYNNFASISIIKIRNEGLLMLNELLEDIDKKWTVIRKENKIVIENTGEIITILNEKKSDNIIYDLIIKHIKFINNKTGIFQDFIDYKLELSLENILDDDNIKLFQINSNNYLVCEDFSFDKTNFIKLVFDKVQKLNGIIFTEKTVTICENKITWEIYNKNGGKSVFNSNALLCLGKYIYNKYELDNESLYSSNNLIVDYYINDNNEVGLTFPEFEVLKINDFIIDQIKDDISLLNIINIDDIRMFRIGSKHLVLELDNNFIDINSDLINMFGSMVLNICKENNIFDLNINFMFYDHDKEKIYHRIYENGIFKETICHPTGCVASLIYYLELYENQQDDMKKDIYYNKENKIEIKLEENTYSIESDVTSISKNELL